MMSVSSPIIQESLEHGASVARIADMLYAGLRPLHMLTTPWDGVLHTAARLHDIGWLYGKRGHHKASASMIRAGEIETVPKHIRPLVALVARYHRRAAPSLQQWRFAALSAEEQHAVCCLAAIIRLADALDFSHTSCVQHVHVHIETHVVRLGVAGSDSCLAEIARIDDKKELFTHIFGKDVVAQSMA